MRMMIYRDKNTYVCIQNNIKIKFKVSRYPTGVLVAHDTSDNY